MGCGGGGGATSGDSDGDPDTGAIELPAELDGYKEIVAQIKAKNEESKVVVGQEKNQEATAKATVAAEIDPKFLGLAKPEREVTDMAGLAEAAWEAVAES